MSGIDVTLELMPGAARPTPPQQGDPPEDPGPAAGGPEDPLGQVEHAGGPEPDVQNAGVAGVAGVTGATELPFTGPELPLGWLAVSASVFLGLGVALVQRGRFISGD